MKVVVVGAGFGGLSAARALSERGDVQVTIVERRNHHLFQALLYQVASAGLSPSEVAAPVRAIFRTFPNVEVCMDSVCGLERSERRLNLTSGRSLDYDYLILSLGVQTSYYGHPEWAVRAPGLKSIEDATTVRRRVLWSFEQAEIEPDAARQQALMTLVVIGGGATGVELAGAFAELRRSVLRWDFRRIQPETARVILIEGSPRLLSGFHPTHSRNALEQLRDLGVEVWLEERVQAIEDEFLVTRGPLGERTLATRNVVWAAGVRPHDLVCELGLSLHSNGRVLVHPGMQSLDDERIFCVGDMVHYEHPGCWKGRPLPGVAAVAMQQGRLAARNALRHQRGLSLKPLRYRHPGDMATVGRQAAVADWGPFKLKGIAAWLIWLVVHLFRIVDFQNRALVFMRWAWAYVTWRWGVRLITHLDQEEKPS